MKIVSKSAEWKRNIKIDRIVEGKGAILKGRWNGKGDQEKRNIEIDRIVEGKGAILKGRLI
jgi:hypothetical protein